MGIDKTPEEYDRAIREFIKYCFEREVDVHQTSGRRTLRLNRKEESSDQSKHIYAMADDFNAARPGFQGMMPHAHATVIEAAKEFDLYFKLYPWGIHLQGLKRGPVAKWWAERYWLPDWIKVGE